MKRTMATKTRQAKRAAGPSATRAKSPRLSAGGKRIVSALEEVAEDVRGREPLPRRSVAVPDHVDVLAIREKLGMSQSEFAGAYGFSVATVRNWEQHRREPDGAAKVLLAVIERAPETVRQALSDPGA